MRNPIAVASIVQGMAWRPRSPDALYEYLCGRWQLTKSMDYTPGGGVAGEFVGVADFEPLRCADGGVRLSYLEDGMATLGGGQSVSATKRLLWDLSTSPVHVHFDEARDRDPEAILEGARFFHTIELPVEAEEDPPPFEHWCTPDTYRGSLTFESSDAFLMTWQVQGPKKLGNIVGKYARSSPSETS